MSTAAAPLVLALDQGTTTSKALLVDAGGTVVARGRAPVGIRHPRPGWVEQDADDLWTSVLAAIAQCLQAVPDARPSAVAVSNQRESVVAWDRRTGVALGPVLGWQDARSADRCEELLRHGAGELVRRRTGLSVDPMFSAPKMAWLRTSLLAAGADASTLALGTVESWLVWRLTGGAVFAAEAGNASRTLLLDLERLDWDPELLALFDVPRSCLGEVRASDGGFGTTVATGALPGGVPVVAAVADSHAALFTHAAYRPTAAKATYGTGSSVMARVPGLTAAPPGTSTTLAWLLTAGGPAYAREGNILATGAALDWAAALVGCPPGEPGGAYLTRLASAVDDAGQAVLVPAFSGLGAPYWDRRATALVTGLTPDTGPAHLARAALDAVAHQVTDVVEAMESDGGTHVDVLHADGGATASGLLVQIQADLLARPVHVADVPDASPLGAALLALAALGCPPVSVTGHTPAQVLPLLGPRERQDRRARWRDAVRRARLERDDAPDTTSAPPDPTSTT